MNYRKFNYHIVIDDVVKVSRPGIQDSNLLFINRKICWKLIKILLFGRWQNQVRLHIPFKADKGWKEVDTCNKLGGYPDPFNKKRK